jgi:hypothetical protein
MAEALARKQLDEEDWAIFERGDAPEQRETLAELSLTISNTDSEGGE